MRPIQTRFRYGFGCNCLNLATKSNSPAHSPKGTPSHLALPVSWTSRSTPRRGEPQSVGTKKRHSAPTACRHTVSGSISLPSPGNFSPFPHGTCSLSVARECLALGGGPPGFPQDFPCPVVLKVIGRSLVCFRLRDCHPLRFPFPVEFS
jgi:hypothetical protein